MTAVDMLNEFNPIWKATSPDNGTVRIELTGNDNSNSDDFSTRSELLVAEIHKELYATGAMVLINHIKSKGTKSESGKPYYIAEFDVSPNDLGKVQAKLDQIIEAYRITPVIKPAPLKTGPSQGEVRLKERLARATLMRDQEILAEQQAAASENARQKTKQPEKSSTSWTKADAFAEELRQEQVKRRNRPVDRVPVVGETFSKGGQPGKPAEGVNPAKPEITDHGFDATGIKFGPYKRDHKTGLYLDDAGLAKAREAFGNDPHLLVRITHHMVSEKHGRDTFRFETGEVVQAVHYKTPQGRGAMSHLAFQTNKIDASSGDIILDKLEAEGHSIDKIEISGTPEFQKNAKRAIAIEKTRRKDALVDELKVLQKDTLPIDEAKLLLALKQAVKDGKVPTSVVTRILREEMTPANAIGKEFKPDIRKIAAMAGIPVPESKASENTITGAGPKAAQPDNVKAFVRKPAA